MGRQGELAALRAHGDGRGLVVVRGPRGSGRSAVLARAGRDLADRGVVVLEAPGTAQNPEWDRYGVHTVLGALRERFEDVGERLVDAVEVLDRLCAEDAYATAWGRFRLLNALGTVFARIGGGRVALVVDDADRLPAPTPVVAAVRRAGQLVLASCTTGADAALCEAADRVVDLGPLPDQAVDRVLRQAARAPVDQALRRALEYDLGPLWGNPATVVSTVADLRRRGRLVAVHGHLCLRDPGEPIALPAGHPLLEEVAACGDVGRDLVLLAASDAGFGVDDVPAFAAATGRPEPECGHAVDRLVLAGVLDADRTGRLGTRCPAVAAAVAGSSPATGPGTAAARLHRAIATTVLDGGVRGVRPAALAGHVAAAGRTLPARPDLVDHLREAELSVPPADTARHAALRHATWWHARESHPAGAAQPVAADLVRLYVRTGDHARLAAFVEEPAGTDLVAREELAAAAALAAVHLGQPLPATVRAAVTGPDPAAVPAAVGFCDRWSAGAVVRLAEVEAAFAPLRHPAALPTIEGRTRRGRAPAPAVERALADRDLVAVFESVLGSRYGTPTEGPLAAYHRLRAGYAAGAWTDALSAARELEVDPRADPGTRTRSRLLAAEMCGWRGEDRRAAAWLASVPQDCAAPATRGWVEVGLLHHAGDVPGALRAGVRAAARARSRDGADRVRQDASGLGRLLRRVAAIAVEAGDALHARRARAEAERWCDRDGTPDARETLLHVRSAVDGDGAPAAVRLARRRGTAFDLALACQEVGRTAADPQPWLHEALGIARTIGAARLTARARRAMGERGVAAPAARGGRADLTGVELRIIGLVRLGRTNRQIALAERVSEKTVEKHLTRLFTKAGCRTRHGLATSGLGGRPEPLGA
ncbi:LuxR family transcriptional regulator [Actinosynnema sp. NPDC050436]|uniref:helix-turn-helix transcriptional regulator n=1 Tax=Actinosynnema sp. NPDC050436 TaxID=3155659 RepID=UPI00340C1237